MSIDTKNPEHPIQCEFNTGAGCEWFGTGSAWITLERLAKLRRSGVGGSCPIIKVADSPLMTYSEICLLLNPCFQLFKQ
jgi:hypothetical protein